MVEPLRNDVLGAGARAGVAVDAGLRAHMLRVYNYMASGVLFTGIVALLVYSSPAAAGLLFTFQDGTIAGYTILGWVALLSPLAFVLAMSFGLHKMSAATLQLLFWAFAGVMGLSLSSIFFVYTGVSIAKIFFITSASFAGLSLWGYTTKKDLSAWGSFLFMGLIGVIIAMVVNWFLASAMLDFIVSIIGVLVFAGLTAYDTQKIRNLYDVNAEGSVTSKQAIMGALALYLDFINMLLFLLRLFGNRR
jgi:uncharacterized protein